MPFNKSFDTILNTILTDYRNAADRRSMIIDTSEGSEIFLKASVLASLGWSFYKDLDWVLRQILPSTCDSDWLDSHAARFGIVRAAGEQDASLLQRLLAYFRNPLGGGNRYDYMSWARSASVAGSDRPARYQSTNYAFGDVVRMNGSLYFCCSPGTSSNDDISWDTSDGAVIADGGVTWKQWESDSFTELVKNVWVFSNKRGVGSVDIVIDSNYDKSSLTFNAVGVTPRYVLDPRAWFTAMPSNQLIAAAHAIIDDKRPLTAWDFVVTAPTNLSVGYFTIDLDTSTLSGVAESQLTADNITADLVSQILGMNVCQSLNETRVRGIVFRNGVDASHFDSWEGPISAAAYQDENDNFIYPRIWPFNYTYDYMPVVGITVLPAGA